MNIEQVKQLASQGESARLEFKNSTVQIKAAFKTIRAFLNTSARVIIFGVKDNGKLIGQQISDQTKQELAK